ncbi:DUF6776 family protein [Thermomonas sp.]|uniref:DUF6776 family protein n=1 Tax=Thermomonas sp. TaxID=1971895 RepID=UPI00391DA07B
MDLPSPLQRLRHRGHPGIALGLLVGAALLLGVWGAWRSFAPAPANARERLALQARRIEALAQANATLARSDQISRQANAALQNTLAERDEEIAGLRADVAFYERFVGPTGQRRGLSVHALKLLPQRDPQLWHFVATLTQNLNRGAINSGRLQLAMEVTDGGSMRRLDWTVLRQQAGAADIAYAFRYFQRVEGDIVLPRGVRPVRVVVRLLPDAGATVERAFTWSEATAADAPGG